jgi:N-acetylneuraminate synthase
MKRVFIIAEIAQGHDGSLGIAHSYIDSLAQTGVDAVKFQTHIAEAESSKEEQFRTQFSYEDNSRFDYWKRMEFSLEQWEGLKNHSEKVGLEFMSSPFSVSAVELLEKIKIKRYKIGSGELNNFLMLHHIAITKKPIILSSGMSDWNELDHAVQFLQKYNNPLTLLQCTTSYPTKPNQWGLRVLKEMKDKYKLPIGFSDHSGDIAAPIAAVALGAEVIEFHVVFHKQMFGPDSKASITIEATSKLVNCIRDISESLDAPSLKEDNTCFDAERNLFGKSISVNKSLPIGHYITLNDLESKKPARMGVPASNFQSVIGKKLKKAKQKWDFLTDEDIY